MIGEIKMIIAVKQKGEQMSDDLISREAAIREYQKVCKGIKCGECPFLIKVNTEEGSHLITDCKLEAFLHDLSPAQRWTPIDKDWPDRGELPDEYVNVLISINEDEVCESYRKGDYWFLDETFVPLDFADAWMFMPKPYKGEA